MPSATESGGTSVPPKPRAQVRKRGPFRVRSDRSAARCSDRVRLDWERSPSSRRERGGGSYPFGRRGICSHLGRFARRVSTRAAVILIQTSVRAAYRASRNPAQMLRSLCAYKCEDGEFDRAARLAEPPVDMRTRDLQRRSPDHVRLLTKYGHRL